jgi:toxin ParE1/3/4
LTPELEKLIKEKVKSGRYLSSSEVVREGLRLLEERDRLRVQKLDALRRDVELNRRSGETSRPSIRTTTGCHQGSAPQKEINSTRMALYQETSQAKDDLSAVVEYIAADNPDAAERFLARVESDYRRLANAPELGRPRDEIAHDVRSFPVANHNYLVFYRPISEGILILRFLHSARDIELLL